MKLVNKKGLQRPLFSALFFLASFLFFASHSAVANTLKSVRSFPSPDNTRVVFDLSSQPDYKLHYLTSPDRLVLDFASTQNKFNLRKLKHKGPLVKNIRESKTSKKGVYRVVIDLRHQSLAKKFVLKANKSYKYYRLIFDIPHKKSAKVKVAPVKKVARKEVKEKLRDVVIAIDAGHGGEDPGASGRYSKEKNITLKIAKRLQKRINKQKGMRAFLTRKGDYYLSLTKRTEIAVKENADFFVSLHADGFTSSQPSGASVWVSSDRRSNRTANKLMRDQEKESRRIGGGHSTLLSNLVSGENVANDVNLQMMLLGMAKSKRSELAYIRGGFVLKEVKKVTKLHKKRPQKASLAVLRMPYFPSILVEAGFITNHREEKLLNSGKFQQKIANAVFKGIYNFYSDYPPPHTVFYKNQGMIRHTVRSGESLSIIASNYSVSQSKLKSLNKLKSSKLHIGQVIKIPANYQVSTQYKPAPNHRAIQAPQKNKSQQRKNPLIHTVKRGESLSVIAHRYGYISADLIKLNKLKRTSVQVGQKLKIPTTKVSPEPVKMAKAKSKTITHTVKRGESLSVIARRYGKTSAQLTSFNKLRSTSLAVGQKIKIPNVSGSYRPSSVAKKQLEIVHTVKRGQTLSLIGSFYGRSARELITYNHLKKASVWVGQKIKVPVKTTKMKKHKVKRGDSLSRIAKRYGVKSSTLKSFNNLRSSSLAIGQVLRIPVS